MRNVHQVVCIRYARFDILHYALKENCFNEKITNK